MKILVDELPYEEEECLFRDRCNHANSLWCPIDNTDDYDGDECYYYKTMSSHQDYMRKLIQEVRYAMEDIYE